MANCATATKGKGSLIFNGLVGFFVCMFLTATLGVFAEEKQAKRPGRNGETRNAAATADESLQDALRRIPWDSLSPTAQAKIKPVVTSHSIFRRLPLQTVYTDSEIYQFLVEHPDVVVGFWEKFGVTQVSLRELSENRFLMKETGGTTAVATVLHRTKNLCIVHAKGQYRGPLLAKPIDGEVVLFLRSRFFRDEDNEPYVVCQLDSFVRLDNIGADLVAKLLSNVLGKIADSNFEQTVGFVGNVSEASVYNTDRVQDLISQLKGVRKEVRDDFSDIVDHVASRGTRHRRVFSEYVELPIPKEHIMEPAPFAAQSIPMPVIARQTQQVLPEPVVAETSVPTEATLIHVTVIPIATGLTTLVDESVRPSQSRVIFRKPTLPSAFEE